MSAHPRPRRAHRRTLITGLGPITAFGVGIDPLWSALCEGRSAIRRIRLDPSGFPCQVAAEIPDELFDVKSVVPKSYRKATKVMARDIELAVGAAAAAIKDAGLVTKAVDAEARPTIPSAQFGCHIGAGLIAADADELAGALVTSRDAASGDFDISHWGSTGMQNLTPLWLLKYLPNMLACHVTIIHDCEGPSNTITCAEASAMLSMGESQRAIQRGAADACLTGGAECKLNTMGHLRQWFAKRLMKTDRADDPGATIRPFDREAAGSALGEGGGLVVLEAEDSASSRDAAKVYCEMAGFAATQSYSSDATGTEIDEQGESISDAIALALAAAKMNADEIDCIAPFGSGIASVDQVEAAAMRKVFGDRVQTIPLITTIPNVGNTTAGSGAVAVSAAAMALKTQTLPARINTRNAIDGLMANATPSQSARLRSALIVSTGMGGQNAAIVLRAM